MAFQQTGQKRLNRSEHVWYHRAKSGTWKCVLCGAVCSKPPECPTPKDWMPDTYESLTKDERALYPYQG